MNPTAEIYFLSILYNIVLNKMHVDLYVLNNLYVNLYVNIFIKCKCIYV